MGRYIIIAGVNGAGKTTFYSSEDFFYGIEKINFDETVREIGSWRNPSDHIRAGRVVLKRINNYFNNHISFSQETTLCGHNIINNIMRAKNLGYVIELYYIGLENPEIAKKRVKHRIDLGGHGVSDEYIDRRYSESIKNLKLVIPLCDKVLVYDNSTEFIRIAIFKNGNCERISANLPGWFKNVIEASN